MQCRLTDRERKSDAVTNFVLQWISWWIFILLKCLNVSQRWVADFFTCMKYYSGDGSNNFLNFHILIYIFSWKSHADFKNSIQVQFCIFHYYTLFRNQNVYYKQNKLIWKQVYYLLRIEIQLSVDTAYLVLRILFSRISVYLTHFGTVGSTAETKEQ